MPSYRMAVCRLTVRIFKGKERPPDSTGAAHWPMFQADLNNSSRIAEDAI